MPDYLTKRGGIWIYKRRVPQEFSRLDQREFVKQSTKIRVDLDRNGLRARHVAEQIDATVEAYWHGLVTGQAVEAKRKYDEARQRARSMGFTYRPAAEVAKEPLEQILARLERIAGRHTDESVVSAMLGGETPPPIRISTLFETFQVLVRDELRGMSEQQLVKWRTRKKRAISNLLSVVGDKDVTALTRSDAIEYRTWWQDRILERDLDVSTANKDIGHIKGMLTAIEIGLQIGLVPIFADLRLRGHDEEEREAFDPDFVQSKLLDSNALAGLNEEARRVIYIMADTGMRPSEIVNLSDKTIVLGAAIPHVKILPDGRRMKTEWSRRDIPLVGAALAAARAQAHGFPRYKDKSDSLSATINKYLKENDLRPTLKTTLYSLRHTFEDRLTAVEPPDKIIAMLMGHKFERPRYGKGPSLSQKQKWLQRIAFKPPVCI